MKDKFTPNYIPQLAILGHSRNAKMASVGMMKRKHISIIRY